MVPGGASLVAWRVLTRSNVVTDAARIAMARAIANRARAVRWLFIDKPSYGIATTSAKLAGSNYTITGGWETSMRAARVESRFLGKKFE